MAEVRLLAVLNLEGSLAVAQCALEPRHLCGALKSALPAPFSA
jgi:hypothetical protein